MPIYPYRCTECGHTKESLLDMSQRNETPFCPECGSFMRRAMELQNVITRPDIEPGYDVSLGTYVGSRKQLREELAYRDAYNPDLMTGSEPQAGRLTKEERAIEEGKDVRQVKTIFERRKEPGWGKNPSEGDILKGYDPKTKQDIIVSEGDADYGEIKEYIKERSANAARDRQDKAG